MEGLAIKVLANWVQGLETSQDLTTQSGVSRIRMKILMARFIKSNVSFLRKPAQHCYWGAN